MENQDQNVVNSDDREIDNLLVDPTKRATILQRLARLDPPTFPMASPMVVQMEVAVVCHPQVGPLPMGRSSIQRRGIPSRHFLSCRPSPLRPRGLWRLRLQAGL